MSLPCTPHMCSYVANKAKTNKVSYITIKNGFTESGPVCCLNTSAFPMSKLLKIVFKLNIWTAAAD